jgi:hypothetical protein
VGTFLDAAGVPDVAVQVPLADLLPPDHEELAIVDFLSVPVGEHVAAGGDGDLADDLDLGRLQGARMSDRSAESGASGPCAI